MNQVIAMLTELRLNMDSVIGSIKHFQTAAIAGELEPHEWQELAADLAESAGLTWDAALLCGHTANLPNNGRGHVNGSM